MKKEMGIICFFMLNMACTYPMESPIENIGESSYTVMFSLSQAESLTTYIQSKENEKEKKRIKYKNADSLIKIALETQDICKNHRVKIRNFVNDDITINKLKKFSYITRMSILLSILYRRQDLVFEQKKDIFDSLYKIILKDNEQEIKKNNIFDSQEIACMRYVYRHIFHENVSEWLKKKEICLVDDKMVSPGDQKERTILGHAVVDNMPILVAMLCALRANPSEPSKEGISPLEDAMDNADLVYMLPVLMYFDTNNCFFAGESKLIYLIKHKTEETILPLVPYVAKKCINEQEEFTGNTALHYAATKGYASLITLLAHYGADIRLCNKRQETPLYPAIKNQHKEAVEALLNFLNIVDERKYVNTKDILGVRPLSYALVYDTAVEELIQAGADPHKKSNMTPLLVANRLNIGEAFLQNYQDNLAESEDALALGLSDSTDESEKMVVQIKKKKGLSRFFKREKHKSMEILVTKKDIHELVVAK